MHSSSAYTTMRGELVQYLRRLNCYYFSATITPVDNGESIVLKRKLMEDIASKHGHKITHFDHKTVILEKGYIFYELWGFYSLKPRPPI